MYYYFNDRIVSAEEAKVSVRDIAVLRGFGIFDFFRTQNGRPFLIDDYLHRFKNSARLLGLPLQYSTDQLKSIVLETLQANKVAEAGIRLVLTGGESENAFMPGRPAFAVLIEKLHWPDEEWFANGVKLLTYQHQRELSQIKTINYITAIALQNRIRDEGAVDLLYHSGRQIREVTRSNFFIVKDGVVITPDSHILFGVTRKKALELAKMFYNVEERAVALEELKAADECFMTGTTKKITPVVNIDGTAIGDGLPGKVTRRLMKLFAEFESGN